MLLKVSDPSKEGVYQGAKWLKIQALFDADELLDFFSLLNPFWIFPLTGKTDGNPVSCQDFCKVYGEILQSIKEGKAFDPICLRKIFASALTSDLDSLWLQEISNGQFLTKISKPTVLIQSHYFSFSELDRKIYSNSMGFKSVFWGFQLSFPQVYQDPKTLEFFDLGPSPLFKQMQRLVRDISLPVSFVYQNEKINTSMRLGKKCYAWIDHYEILRQQNLQVFHP